MPEIVAATPYRRTSLLLLSLSAAFGVLLLFAAAMARPMTYDEDQYLAAGSMAAQGLLPYRDFAFLQAPLYPFLLGAAMRLSGGYAVLSGRLLSFALALAAGVLLWRVLRRLGADRVLAAVLLAACLTSPFLASPLVNVRNDGLALVLFLSGLLVHLVSGDRSFWGRLLAALLMGLAVETKVTYLFAPLALGVHALFWPARRLLPVLLGTAVAAVPAVLLLAAAGPEPVWFGLYGFHHAASPDWYRQQGLETQLDSPVRLQNLLGWLFMGGNVTLLASSVALALITVARKRKWKRPGQLLVGMLVGAVVLDFQPSPSWAMYYAALAPLLACCIAHLDRVTTHLADPVRKRLLVLVAALPVVPAILMHGPELVRFARGEWVGPEAHRTALAVRAALPAGGAVATLFPHAVMDMNATRVDLATGPFVFRSGHLYLPEQLSRLHALSPAVLAAAFERDPPAAIFAGSYRGAFRTAMDQALTDYAEQRDWRLVLTAADGGRLWVRP